MKIKPVNEEQIQLFNAIEEKENEKETRAEFRVISCRDIDNLELSYKQIVVLLEGLYNFKLAVKKLENNNYEAKLRHDRKLKQIDQLFEFLQNGIKYDFEGVLNKCKNKWAKEKNDAAGMETFSWLEKQEAAAPESNL